MAEVKRRFQEEPEFDTEQYETYLRRIRYDDRDAVMYENMLRFLWTYVIRPGCLNDYDGVLQEYTRWNLQRIERCFYHRPHDLPYANLCRAYQTVVYLLGGRTEDGLNQFALMGPEPFCYDGKAPKVHLDKNGTCYRPVSKLFLLYNYYKVLLCRDEERAEALREQYPFAFTCFDDGGHEEHDAFLKDQLKTCHDRIFYPVYDRIYKIPWAPTDFYLYFDEEKYIPLSQVTQA